MAKEPVFLVLRVATAILKSNPAILEITADGLATTSGWTDPKLEPYLGPLDPPADTVNFDFVAEPPIGQVQELMWLRAHYRMYPMPDRVASVCVHSANNGITVPAGHSSPDPVASLHAAAADGGEAPFPLGQEAGGGGDKPFPLGRRGHGTRS